MKTIKISRGKEALVDDDDYSRFSNLNWCCHKTKYGSLYVIRTRLVDECNLAPGPKTQWLHREIMNAKKGEIVDHKNRNGLDCRKENLRFVTAEQNTWNISARRHSRSGIRGVSFDSKNKKWRGDICVSGKRMNLGRFKTIEEASKVCEEAIQKYFGVFAGK